MDSHEAGGASPTPEPPAVLETPAPGDTFAELWWNGKRRVWKVHAPASYDGKTALPVVFVLHFYPGDGNEAASTTGMKAKADKENFLAVFPDGWAAGYNAAICCGAEDDVGLIRRIAERMVTRWKADPKRFYVTGISNGADMSFKLAVEASDIFRAAAPVSGSFWGPKSLEASYKPKTPVSIVTFQGGSDARFLTPMKDGAKLWRERNSCTPSAPVELGRKQTDPITRTDAKCADGSDFTVYSLPDMTHAWPGSSGPLGDPSAGLNATDLIWDFFKAH